MPEENSQNSNTKKFKILLTSFEPMPDSDGVNMSAEVAKSIKAPDGVEVVLVTLPNDYEKAKELLDKAVAENSPDYVISLGESNVDAYEEGAKEFALNIETTAQGLFGYSDKMGCSLDEFPAFLDENKVYIECVNKPLNEYIVNNYSNDIDCISNVSINSYASDYLCNFTFYNALNAMDEMGKKGGAVFIHLKDPIVLRQNENFQDNLQYKVGLEFYSRAIEDIMVFVKNDVARNGINVEYSCLNISDYVGESAKDLQLSDAEKNEIEKDLYFSLFGIDFEDLFQDSDVLAEVNAIETIKIGELTPPGCPSDVKIKQPSAKPVR